MVKSLQVTEEKTRGEGTILGANRIVGHVIRSWCLSFIIVRPRGQVAVQHISSQQ